MITDERSLSGHELQKGLISSGEMKARHYIAYVKNVLPSVRIPCHKH